MSSEIRTHKTGWLPAKIRHFLVPFQTIAQVATGIYPPFTALAYWKIADQSIREANMIHHDSPKFTKYWIRQEVIHPRSEKQQKPPEKGAWKTSLSYLEGNFPRAMLNFGEIYQNSILNCETFTVHGCSRYKRQEMCSVLSQK